MTYFNNKDKELAFYGDRKHVLRGDEEYWTVNATQRLEAGFEHFTGQPIEIDENDEKFVLNDNWKSGKSNDFKAKLVNPALLPDGVHAEITPPYVSTEQSPYTSHIKDVVERIAVGFHRMIVKWGKGTIVKMWQQVGKNTEAEMLNGFNYLDDTKKVPRIVDELTYNLGVMLYDELLVIKTGGGIPGKFTKMAEDGLPVLEARLKYYEAHRNKEQINQTVAPLLERNNRTAAWQIAKARFDEDSKKDTVSGFASMSEQELMGKETPALDDIIAEITDCIAYLEEKNATFTAFNREQQEALAALPENLSVSNYMRVLATPTASEQDKIKAWQDLFNGEMKMSPEAIRTPLARQCQEGNRLCQTRATQIGQLQQQLALLTRCRTSKLQADIGESSSSAGGTQTMFTELRAAADEAKRQWDAMPEGKPKPIENKIQFISGPDTNLEAQKELERRLEIEKDKIKVKAAQKIVYLDLESRAQLADIATQQALLNKDLDQLGQPLIQEQHRSLLVNIGDKPVDTAITSLETEAQWMQKAKRFLNASGKHPQNLINSLDRIKQCWDTWDVLCQANPDVNKYNNTLLLEEYTELKTVIDTLNQQYPELQKLVQDYEEALLILRLKKLDTACKSLLDRINAVSDNQFGGLNHADEISLEKDIQKQLTAMVQLEAANPGKKDQIRPVIDQYEGQFLQAQSTLNNKIQFEDATLLKLSALYKEYFQGPPGKLGVFPKYLRDRNEKYQFIDWVSSFFHWLWTPEKEAREDFVHSLEGAMKGICPKTEELPDPDKIAALNALILEGKGKFHPRSSDREQSLLARLEHFQTALEKITNEIKNVPQTSVSSPGQDR